MERNQLGQFKKGMIPWNKTTSTKNCFFCEKEYTPSGYQLKKGYGKYCSSKCFGKSISKEKVRLRCFICMKVFYTFPSNTTKKYCGRECFRNKPKKTNSNCVICSKQFYIRPIKIKSYGNCCSKECKNTSQIGKAPWNKGIKYLAITGSKNPNWKGGATSINEKLRKSLEYEAWRKSVLERDLYTCRECGEVGGRLEADHIKPWSLFPEYRFDANNGRTLCHECHTQTETYLNSRMKKEDFI